MLMEIVFVKSEKCNDSKRTYSRLFVEWPSIYPWSVEQTLSCEEKSEIADINMHK